MQQLAGGATAVLLAVTIALSPDAAAAAAAETFQGVPRIVDGDTLVVRCRSCMRHASLPRSSASGHPATRSQTSSGCYALFWGCAVPSHAACLTRQVDGNKVRLFGVDAPESKQSCSAADGSQYLCGGGTELFFTL